MTTRERFFSKVKKTSTCWLWTGSLNNAGYGEFGLRGVAKSTHVLAHRWIKKAKKGQIVDHKCKVRCCVRPGHLRLTDWKGNRANSGAFKYAGPHRKCASAARYCR